MAKIHDTWHASLKATEKVARARKWQVRPLKVHPVAKAADLAKVEKTLGRPIPRQLRVALLELSSRIDFGWSIPVTAAAGAAITGGGLSRSLWDLQAIKKGPASLERWLRVADQDEGDFEEAHTRKMWDGHVPFVTLANGDLLTIDASKGGAQPVRYFSHEIEGLHGKIIAPDFDTFMTEYFALGCAGQTHDDWMKLGVGKQPLRASSPAAKAWLKWFATGVAEKPKIKPNVTPKVIKAASPADLQLVTAAKAGKLPGVEAALAAGANIDCAGREGNAYRTAIDYAATRSNYPLLELLAARGASVHTPANALGIAAEHGDARLVTWFLDRGCYPGSRSNDYESPVESVLVATVNANSAGKKRLLANLELLLEAGADPNEGSNDLCPPLVTGDAATIAVMIRHGADPNRGGDDGFMPLHAATTKAQVLALKKAGARPNVVFKGSRDDPGRSPLQWALTQDDLEPGTLEAMIQIGCDPKVTDTAGKTAFYYCFDLARTKLVLKGFKPTFTDGGGNTLLHAVVDFSLLDSGEIPKVITYLVKDFKVDLDAQNKAGDTALHLAMRDKNDDAIATLRKLGADATIKNKKGKLPR